MSLTNSYEDTFRAESYAKLEFPGTYYLAYRDLPKIIQKHVQGFNALDFGCGTGRSTRFLKKLGYNAIGIDISEDMINKAKEFDCNGKYLINMDDSFTVLGNNKFDLILSVFTFDNIPLTEKRLNLFKGLHNLLSDIGIIVMLDATPELYKNDWASFNCTCFEENFSAKNGDIVKTIMLDVEDRRPVEDILSSDDEYRKYFLNAGLNVAAKYLPLGFYDEPFNWINETKIAPWVIYVLKKK